MKIIRLKSVALTGKAPSEILLLPFGEVETANGTFKFTEASAKSVLAMWEKRGREMGWDWEHQTFADPPVEAPASAWSRLELRDDGLWAVDIKWTAKATERIEAGEYRFWSPVLWLTEDGEILDVLNVALTNFPATFNQAPLATLREASGEAVQKIIGSAEEAREWVQLVEMAYDTRRALVWAALRLYVQRLLHEDYVYCYAVDLFEDRVVFELSDYPGRLWSLAYALEGAAATFQGAPMEVIRTYTEIGTSAGTLSPFTPVTLKEKTMDETQDPAAQAAPAAKTPAPAAAGHQEELVEVVSLKSRVAALEAEKLLGQYSRKITPAMQVECKALAVKDPAAFVRLMETLPELLPAPLKPGAPGLDAPVLLTEGAKRAAEMCGLSIEDVQKYGPR